MNLKIFMIIYLMLNISYANTQTIHFDIRMKKYHVVNLNTSNLEKNSLNQVKPLKIDRVIEHLKIGETSYIPLFGEGNRVKIGPNQIVNNEVNFEVEFNLQNEGASSKVNPVLIKKESILMSFDQPKKISYVDEKNLYELEIIPFRQLPIDEE